MTKPRSRASDPGPALAERLARMSIAEIDAMSDREVAELMGATEEEIARLAGHSSSRTTETIYRRELRPVITTGAEIMDQIFTG